MMVRNFLRNVSGNYLLISAIAMVPIMGALALAIDYSELSRERQATLNALDAANVATGHYIAQGASDAQAIAYAHDFFNANLGGVDPADTTLQITMPNDNSSGGGTLKMAAQLEYKPYFLPTFHWMLGEKDKNPMVKVNATSEVRLKNTLEVALVLDNSGSMDDKGSGSSKKRIDLLKEAAKQLVSTIAGEAAQMKQLEKPVQFGLVPFAGAVNIGPAMATKSWMDQDGISPIQHENFDWSTMSSGNKRVEKISGVYYKKGSGWGAQENEVVTRFTLYKDLKRITGTHKVQTGTQRQQQCTGSWWNSHCEYVDVPVYTDVPDYGAFTSWQGCVEMRPYPYSLNDEPPSTGNPATLYVPMFAPDETDKTDSSGRPANNNWWPDETNSNDAARQAYMPKYFDPQNTGSMGDNAGPNAGCTTKPITPLTDVSKSSGETAIDNAIDAMQPLGATNVTEGLAWGWRVVSHGAPFTEGRAETEHGNDKVVIVLTDGANTYYTPGSVTANSYSGSNWNYGANDSANNKSIYSDYGYARNRAGQSRIFDGTTGVNKNDFSNANYTKAMSSHMAQICQNAKDAGLMVMTVALDLDAKNSTEKAQIDSLTACASDSRFRRVDGKPVKLFWNATGATLDEKFREIADELSNLRIVG